MWICILFTAIAFNQFEPEAATENHLCARMYVLTCMEYVYGHLTICI